eukprot:15229545-Alexandrium_andersonii.AAC.1
MLHDFSITHHPPGLIFNSIFWLAKRTAVAGWSFRCSGRRQLAGIHVQSAIRVLGCGKVCSAIQAPSACYFESTLAVCSYSLGQSEKAKATLMQRA